MPGFQANSAKKVFIISLIAVSTAVVGSFLIYPLLFSTLKLPKISIDKTDGYKLIIDEKPFFIKGVCYSPIPVGKDYEYNWWGDEAKPWISDGKMMQSIGVNTVRFYRVGKNPQEVKQVIGDLYQKYGIRSLMGNYLGFWNWPPPNYADPEFKELVKAEVLEMVKLYKNEPGVLAWVLGNENNYSFDRDLQRWSSEEIDALATPEEQRKEKARLYYSFVNDLAKEIRKIDSTHLIVMNVGEVMSLDIASQNCPDVDAVGMIAYRGPSFGNLFRQVKQKFDLPVIMTEWGADSFNAHRNKPDERSQAEFLKLQWRDIVRNADPKKGEGNSLGGTLFEWSDEWWKGNENLPHTWSVQDTIGHWGNVSYYYDAEVMGRLNMNEEWWGLVGLADGGDGLSTQRLPKKSFEVMRSLWIEKS